MRTFTTLLSLLMMTSAFAQTGQDCVASEDALVPGVVQGLVDQTQAALVPETEKIFVREDLNFSSNARFVSLGTSRFIKEHNAQMTCYLEFPDVVAGEANPVKISKDRELKIAKTPSIIVEVKDEYATEQTDQTFSHVTNEFEVYSSFFSGYGQKGISQNRFAQAKTDLTRYGFEVKGLSVRAFYSCGFGRINGYGYLETKAVKEFDKLLFMGLSKKPNKVPVEL